ncbi:TnsA-like heteromeric transposase endonuclease subunit [Streptomyces sp. TG1A-60]|uniref:TnsA-like heteromeric transposase endonuclease subunit n=1 Tax=Streptomyces sp. TG1A-60 TaxID=3129111 RepID=UPI0030CB90BD
MSGLGDAVAAASTDALWSHWCTWADLLAPVDVSGGRAGLDLAPGWESRWSVTWRTTSEELTRSVEELIRYGLREFAPMRVFTWRREQRHRPGLPFVQSTGRLHGAESIEEARFLLALDFAGEVTDVVSQPFRMRFGGALGERPHTPDYLVRTRAGVWLIDVRPAELIFEKDWESFAAAAELARVCGWEFAVVGEWLPHIMMTLDWLSSRRRSMADPLQLEPTLLAEAAAGGRTFGELAACTAFPPVARAHLLHLLWHRRLGLDLRAPLGDGSVIVTGKVSP